MRDFRHTNRFALVLETLQRVEARLEESFRQVSLAAHAERAAWWAYCNARRALELAQEERNRAWEAGRALDRQLRRWRR